MNDDRSNVVSGSDASAGSRRSVARRPFLKTVGLGALAGCSGRERESESTPPPSPEPTLTATSVHEGTPPRSGDVRGAVYFPARAYNTYQTWADYDPGEAIRDLGLADAVGLNAVRVFLSFEFWREDRAAMRRSIDHFFATAERQGLAVLPVLFESVGRAPTPQNLRDRSFETSTAVRSPGPAVVRDRESWDAPRRFVEWVVDRVGDHEALLAVEVMNEPCGWEPRVSFCRAMLRAARSEDADVPLTMGSKTPEDNRLYRDPQLDVYQFHYNLPETADRMREALDRAAAVARADEVPIWLTEWQRTRVEPPPRLRPNYSSLASVVRDSEIHGDFFWQLMLKPAYAPDQRALGRLNGLFTEDGEVYELDDARAIADDDGYWKVHHDWPVWVTDLPEQDSDVTSTEEGDLPSGCRPYSPSVPSRQSSPTRAVRRSSSGGRRFDSG